MSQSLGGFIVKMPKRSLGKRKIARVMREGKAGKLHIGKSKKIARNHKQIIAIALSEARRKKKRRK